MYTGLLKKIKLEGKLSQRYVQKKNINLVCAKNSLLICILNNKINIIIYLFILIKFL